MTIDDTLPATDIVFKNQQELEDYASKTKKVLVVMDGYVLDATSFSHHHPGGAGLIKHYSGKPIEEQMASHHPLSLKMANSMVIGSFSKQIKRVIDPRKPLMQQIWNMNHKDYLALVDSPHWLFVPSPRMFEIPLFEMFSHNLWYHIYPAPLIVILYMHTFGLQGVEAPDVSVLMTVLTLLLGIATFSLAEYLLHRFIFHSQKYLFDNRALRYVHFIMHGIHHMLPNDPDRLVYPPALGIITFFLGRMTVAPLLSFEHPVLNKYYWTGFLIGYLAYDTTHYMLHHVETSKHRRSYLGSLQKYHNQHHFGGQEAGFGVSSPLWDIVFQTGFKQKPLHNAAQEQSKNAKEISAGTNSQINSSKSVDNPERKNDSVKTMSRSD